jgi:hypothetical protein
MTITEMKESVCVSWQIYKNNYPENREVKE